MEGTVLGIPSIALSQSFAERGDPGDNWSCAATHGPPLIRRLVEVGWPDGVLLNINFPDLPPSRVTDVAVTTQGTRDQSMLRVDERVDARGITYFWIAFRRIFSDPAEGTDLRAIHEGRISVTPLHMNLTELGVRDRLARVIDGPLGRLG
jgi:5'-nucleotidase